MRIASLLLGVPLVGTILVALIRGPRHLGDEWPTHAEHHLVGGIVLAVGLAAVGLLLLAKPFRERERWAWWGLLVAGVAIFGSFWLGNATVGLGEDGAGPNTAQALLSIIYVAGLGMAWRELERSAP